MSKKNITYMMLIISLFLILNGSILHAKEIDLMDEIINNTGSNVVEYGVSASYITNNIELETLKDTLRTLGYYDSNNVNISEKDNIYIIDFTRGNTYGYIEAANENNIIYVTIDVKEKNTHNNINLLKKNIEGAVEKKHTEVKYYLYLKSKIKGTSIDLCKSNLSMFPYSHKPSYFYLVQLLF